VTADSAHRFPALEIVCQAPPDRLNEDAWVAITAGTLGETLIAAAIDGATTRLTPPPLQRHLDISGHKLTPAAYAARTIRDGLLRHAADAAPVDLRTLLLAANDDLGREMTALFGALALDHMGFPDEVYNALKSDPRYVRLGLPACVATVVEYDPDAETLRFVSAGDTALLVVRRDGSVEIPTENQVEEHDNQVLKAALALRSAKPDLTFRELVQQPQIRKQNLNTGLKHNYVDEHGLPQPHKGIGAVNGQPELRYFLQYGEIELNDVAYVCVMTDGLEWPASADEIFSEHPGDARAQREERRAFMAAEIGRRGLAGYLTLLREVEDRDGDHENYPRMKTHDDATGVLLRFA
jgi:hypothetical protein